MFHISSVRSSPILISLLLNKVPTVMEVDTGAALSIISSTTYRTLFPQQANSLCPSDARLTTYTGQPFTVERQIDVTVSYKGQCKELPLTIVTGSGPSLFGRDWLNHFCLDWQSLHQVSNCDTLLARHSAVFAKGLGLVKDVTVNFLVDPNVTPRFYKARSVPYACQAGVEAELSRLATLGIIEPVACGLPQSFLCSKRMALSASVGITNSLPTT